MNALWPISDAINAENLDLIKKSIFVQIAAIELLMLPSHLSEIRSANRPDFRISEHPQDGFSPPISDDRK